ncbi:putative sulfate exporter family transporter [Vulcanisaeta thermophila]|uniref:putative sulfate exporter family transporter n=1 Tax=Vulcanisaeta thermophila TaxID=867917 RepID=UPI0008529AC1|nr:putative sulfate exporter family transporter [Vulcanisaeta thermophila]
MRPEEQVKIDWSSLWRKEDWWALWIGLLIFFLALPGYYGVYLLGWVPRVAAPWLDPSQSIIVVAQRLTMTKAYLGLNPVLSVFFLYLFLLAILTFAAWLMKYNVKRFVAGFTIIFILTFGFWWLFGYAYFNATPDQYAKLHITWSIPVGADGILIYLLLIGLFISNVIFYKKLPAVLEAGARTEWYIKTAIVLLGALVGASSLRYMTIAVTLVERSLIAIVAAYLIYWPISYFLSYKLFKLEQKWAATLASGVSICGVSAAIATAAAIGAPSIVPATIASIIVLFAAVELVILPFVASSILKWAPYAAGAWMGLSVKTDGAAAASGALTDALISAQPGLAVYKTWVLSTAVMTKVFIDIWIGLWAFILAVIWLTVVEKKPGQKVPAIMIWFRFPKFVLGYLATWLILWGIGFTVGAVAASKLMVGGITPQTELFRYFFFALTFMSIGLTTRFKTLAEIKAGRIIAAYVVSLIIIIFIALGLSIAFFAGLPPPA